MASLAAAEKSEAIKKISSQLSNANKNNDKKSHSVTQIADSTDARFALSHPFTIEDKTEPKITKYLNTAPLLTGATPTVHLSPTDEDYASLEKRSKLALSKKLVEFYADYIRNNFHDP